MRSRAYALSGCQWTGEQGLSGRQSCGEHHIPKETPQGHACRGWTLTLTHGRVPHRRQGFSDEG